MREELADFIVSRRCEINTDFDAYDEGDTVVYVAADSVSLGEVKMLTRIFRARDVSIEKDQEGRFDVLVILRECQRGVQ